MEFFNPRGKDITYDNVWKWHKNVLLELECDFLDDVEKNHIISKKRNASESILAWPRKRAYFKHAFSGNFKKSAELLLKGIQRPLILDLGCGVGTQCLYFALMGASVVALDLDKTSLAILRKRISFYEETVLKDKLDIITYCSNAFEFDYSSISPIDGVHSMWAFNNIQPTSKLMSLIAPHMGNGGKFAILDGNNTSWLARYVPSRWRDVLSPTELRTLLEDHGFVIREHCGGIAIPPFAWVFNYFDLLTRLDEVLGKNWFFPVSQRLAAEYRR